MSILSKHYAAGRWIYGLVPIIAGLDKFTNLLVDWSTYLSPTFVSILPFEPQVFMCIVGVVEIIAGAIVFSPYVRLGATIVSIWLVGIAVNLIIAGYYDIAVRDLVMAAGAYHLAVLTGMELNEASLSDHAPAVRHRAPAAA